jgi:ADP-ribose pyrophosphatase YjhB (NUDIX family)
VREECGLEVRAVELVEVFERIIRDPAGQVEYHYVLMDYLCEVQGGALCAGDDAAEAAWVSLHRLAELPMTTGTPDVILKAFQARERRLALTS